MNEGNIALTPLPQSNGQLKNRPIVLLRKLPPYGDWLVCGLSTQLHQLVPGFDDLLDASHPDFASSGLKASSLIRLGFLAVIPESQLLGAIGEISSDRLRRLLQRLSDYLAPDPVS